MLEYGYKMENKNFYDGIKNLNALSFFFLNKNSFNKKLYDGYIFIYYMQDNLF